MPAGVIMTEINYHHGTWQKMNCRNCPLADPTLAHTQTPPGSADDVFLLSTAGTQALVRKHAPVLPDLQTLLHPLITHKPQPPPTP